MKTVYFNVLSHLRYDLSTKTPIFSFASKKIIISGKKMIFEFANHLQEASQEVGKPFILTFYPVLVPNYLQKTSKFRFASKKLFFLAKTWIFEFC